MIKLLFVLILIAQGYKNASCQQEYHSWILGNAADFAVDDSRLTGALALAGGGLDSDDGMRWLLRKALGGDVLVFRNAAENEQPWASANAYNAYFYDDLGVSVDSVETVLLNSRAVANHPQVVNKTRQAEVIFFTGGDQSFYWRFIKDSALEHALHYAMNVRGVAVGGTSAGLAILGEYVFTAMEDSVTSTEALADPYHAKSTLGRRLVRHPLLRNTITDSHFSSRNRFGRLASWMARIWQDELATQEDRAAPAASAYVRGIGVDDRTCVCVDGATGHALVFGEQHAHFVRQTHAGPESCARGEPLTWHQEHTALSVYSLRGMPAPEANGAYFDMNAWLDGSGGEWLYYAVQRGVLSSAPAAYHHWLQGNVADFEPSGDGSSGNGSITMVGGSVGNDLQDEALKWFLRKARGGDVLVFKNTAEGAHPDAEADFYTEYFYGKLGAAVKTNSVETVFLNSRNVSNNPEVLGKVARAEAIYFSGGDQSFYWRLIKNTRLELAMDHAINVRRVAIAGNSAGLAIQGEYIFSALLDSITSAEALRNPYDARVTVSRTLLRHPLLRNTITDTHYAQRDRQGRHVVFMARALRDYGLRHETVNGIGVDENTTVCVDNANGRAYVFGEHEAFFARPLLSLPAPERLAHGAPLTWNQEGRAVRVYKVHGTFAGQHYFDLSTWEGGSGGKWEHWSVQDGQLRIRNSGLMAKGGLSVLLSAALAAVVANVY